MFLPGEFQGWGKLVGGRLWGCAESEATDAMQQQRQACSHNDSLKVNHCCPGSVCLGTYFRWEIGCAVEGFYHPLGVFMSVFYRPCFCFTLKLILNTFYFHSFHNINEALLFARSGHTAGKAESQPSCSFYSSGTEGTVNILSRDFSVVQWLRIHLAKQGTLV